MKIRSTVITLLLVVTGLLLSAGVQVINLLDQVVENERKSANVDEIYHAFEWLQPWMDELLLLALLVVLVLSILLYLYLRIIPPLLHLSTTMQQLSESGDLPLAVENRLRKDEIGVLIRSFNQLLRAQQRSDQQLKATNNALEERVRENHSILESLDEGLVVVDQEGVILQVNQKLKRLLGKPEELLTGQLFHILFESVGEMGLDGLLDSFKSRTQRLHDEDHEAFHKVLSEAPIPLLVADLEERGGVVGAIFLTSQGFDTTFGYSSGELVGRAIAELLPESEWPGLLSRMNGAGTVMSGRREGDKKGCHWKKRGGGSVESAVELLRIECNGRTHILIQLAMAENRDWKLLKMTPYGRLFTEQKERSLVDWEAKHADGSLIPVHLSGSPLYQQSDGRRVLRGAVFVMNDLRSLLSADRARQSNKAKDDFLASMSHELRTPLSAIIGNSEILIEGHLTPDQYKLLHSIEISGRALLALINDMLDFSRITSGKFEVDQGYFNLDLLVEEIQNIFAVRIADAGLHFEVSVRSPMSHQLNGDGRRIVQILINLLSNAIKFTEQGKVTLECWVEHSEGKVHFMVEDQGIGMSAEVMGRLFLPFEQADNTISRRFGGTGLGLHISKALAELMGGTIEVASELGSGSRFEVILPYQQGPLLVQSKQPAQRVINQRFSGRVLIAEDTLELQLLERRILESMGLEVKVVSNGREAIEQWTQGAFDLILMDMQMPEMDG
ncbi:MAG: PAS domain S-box protein, partial [Gammaproteobacteria bacterium]|nr:PAS domain S-box protein [Gammaproteobacteria bacterium]